MLRKIIVSLVLLIIIAGGIFYYTKDGLRTSDVHPLSSVPKNVAVIFQSRNFQGLFHQLSETNLMWQELRQIPYFNQLDSNGIMLDSLISNNPTLNDAMSKSPVYASIHRTGSAKFSMLYTFQLQLENEELIRQLKALQIDITETRVVENATILTIDLGEYIKKEVFITLNNNIVNISFNVVLIEDAIAQIKDKNGLLNDTKFKEVLSTAGEYVDANVYIQYKEFNKLVAALLNPKLGNSFTGFENFANWAAMDLMLKPNALMFNGFTSVNDSSDSYMACFIGQNPQDLDILSIVPDKSSNVISFGISNFERYHEHYLKYLKKKEKYDDYINWIQELNMELSIDLEQELPPIIGNEMGVFYYGSGSTHPELLQYAILRSANNVKAIELLNRISQQVNENEERLIGKLLYSGIIEKYFGLGNQLNPKDYWTISDPYIIFGSSIEAIREYQAQLDKGHMLRDNESFSIFDDNLSAKSSIFLYSNFSKSKNLYQTYLNDEWIIDLEMHKSLLNKFESVAIQYSTGKRNLFYQNIYCNYNPVVKKESKSLWETVLDTSLAIKPATVINHYTNAKEIFIQDVSNKIYLLDNKGNILWVKQLAERIISDVYQIDVYKNNKLQLLFNTKSKLYLIDRKGRHVTNYPVTIPGQASTGLSLLDYDKDRDYRILIPTATKKVLNYGASGSIIKGWSMKSAKEVMQQPIKYFALNGKDYIVGVDLGGNVYVVDRRGEQRVKIDEKLFISKNNQYYLEIHKDISLCKIVASDSSGNVVKIGMDDKKELLSFDDISANHYFEYQDINNDKSYEFIFLDKDHLSCYKQDKSEVFNVTFESAIDHPIMYFSSIGKYGKFGILDKANSQIYLYHDAGGLDTDFPMSGSGNFCIEDINSDGTYDVVVGVDDAVVTYSLKK